MKRYITTIGGDETISFYNTVAALSPDPKHIPVYRGIDICVTEYINTYSIIVSEEDLVMLKLQFKTLKASAI